MLKGLDPDEKGQSCHIKHLLCLLCDKFTANLWFQFCKPMGKVTPFHVFPCCQPLRLETVSPITWQRVLQRGHNLAASPYRVLGREECRPDPVFSDSTAILVRKLATLWLKPPMLCPVPWQGCGSAPSRALPTVPGRAPNLLRY